MEKVINIIRRFVKSRINRSPEVTPSIPLKGYQENLVSIPFVDYLSDDELMELNHILTWKAFVADSSGRRFGNLAWAGKRGTPQFIPDPRHKLLNDRVPLATKKVLEIGCFEGIHTTSLCRLAKDVVAIDSRIENVVKTIVRCGLFNVKPSVFKCDVEQWDVPDEWLKADVCHHIGVLYHLKDPVAHLQKLSRVIQDAVFLDTHIAVPSDQLETYQVAGKTYSYKHYTEGGKKDVFSGMYDHAKWLLLDDLKGVLSSAGFSKIEVLEERAERNGPRVLLLATK
jgi:2-polyprenyl-3-methyl-5-hydroxy-6-metoxy-1,4-benzoquinol methylase